MKAKHTPGPWQFYSDLPSTEPEWHVVTNPSRMRIVANVHIEAGNEMDLANACLIATAPDLLAACECALEWFDREYPGAEHMVVPKTLRAALAKARGHGPQEEHERERIMEERMMDRVALGLPIAALNAAPDLLAALEKLMQRFEQSGAAWMHDPDMVAARAAIAKARGEA